MVVNRRLGFSSRNKKYSG